MNKRQLNGRLKVLAHNVNDNFYLFLKSEEVIREQITQLLLDGQIKEIHWNYNIKFVIDGKEYIVKNNNGGCFTLNKKELEK